MITKVQVLVALTVDVLDPDNDLVSGMAPRGQTLVPAAAGTFPRPATSCNVLEPLTGSFHRKKPMPVRCSNSVLKVVCIPDPGVLQVLHVRRDPRAARKARKQQAGR